MNTNDEIIKDIPGIEGEIADDEAEAAAGGLEFSLKTSDELRRASLDGHPEITRRMDMIERKLRDAGHDRR